MNVNILARKVEISRTNKEWIGRRLSFALRRFSERIRRVTVLMEDINGPRGGVDQRCFVEVHLSPSERIVAEATDADAVLAVSRASNRIARRVRDVISKRRSLRMRNKEKMPEIPSPKGD